MNEAPSQLLRALLRGGGTAVAGAFLGYSLFQTAVGLLPSLDGLQRSVMVWMVVATYILLACALVLLTLSTLKSSSRPPGRQSIPPPASESPERRGGLERAQKELKETTAELERTRNELKETTAKLERTRNELKETTAELERTRNELKETKPELDRVGRDHLPDSSLKELTPTYREKLPRVGDQVGLLWYLEMRGAGEGPVSQHRVMKDAGEAGVYWRLEHLFLLGFLVKERETDGFHRYTLSDQFKAEFDSDEERQKAVRCATRRMQERGKAMVWVSRLLKKVGPA